MDDMTKDMIPRKAVEYCLRKETVSTNPEAYKAHKKFIGYMDDPEISQFGHWMHSNGFNCALISVAVDLEKIPSAQPNHIGEVTEMVEDTISRQAAIDAFAEAMPSLTTPDVCGQFDHDIQVTDEAYVDCMQIIHELPSAQLAKDLPNTCTDVISRQAAIETVRKAQSIGQAHRMLVQLPSAQPERKKGNWIERNPQNSPDCRLIECSECGNAYIVGYNINYDDWINRRNFCMKCGADLRGGGNGKST